MKYEEIDALNFSTLKHIATSPRHYQAALRRQYPDTPALRIGRAAHCYALEGPEQYGRQFAVYEGTRRGKAWAAWREEHGDCDILSVGEDDQARAIGTAVREHPVASRLLHRLAPEIAATWERRGRPCKGRVDAIGSGRIVELKTTSEIAPHRFTNDFARYTYHAQAAWYRHGFREAGHDVGEYFVVSVEKSAPYDVVVYSLPASVLAAGDALVERWLDMLDECERSGKWPGISDVTLPLQLPTWAGGSEGF